MEEIVEYVGKIDMKGLYITNGSALSEKTIDSLARWANVLRVSFNGGTREDYIQVHHKDHFNTVIHHIESIAERRQQYNREDLFLLGITFVVTPENIRHLSQAVQLVKNLGVNFILIRGINPIRYKFNIEERQILADELQKSHVLKDKDFFVSGSISKLDGQKGKKENSSHCYVPNYRLFISADGTVFPCYSAIIQNKKNCGNITMESIIDIWHKKILTSMREELSSQELPGFCSQFCDHIEFNKFIEWVQKQIKKNPDTTFKKIPRDWAKPYMNNQEEKI